MIRSTKIDYEGFTILRIDGTNHIGGLLCNHCEGFLQPCSENRLNVHRLDNQRYLFNFDFEYLVNSLFQNVMCQKRKLMAEQNLSKSEKKERQVSDLEDVSFHDLYVKGSFNL